ncbi:hypothetical protein Tco_0415475 [Tanacetum coccineum]
MMNGIAADDDKEEGCEAPSSLPDSVVREVSPDFSPISTPPSSPTLPWVFTFPKIPSPSLPLLPHSPVLSPAPPPSPFRSLGYQAAMIRMRAKAASTSHSLPLPPPFILSPTRPDAPSLGIPPPLPISVPTLSPPLLPPSASRRVGTRTDVTLHSKEVRDYGFVATMDRRIRSGVIPKREVELWVSRSCDLAHGEVMSLRTTILGQMSEIRELHAADRRRQAVISKMLKADQRRSSEMRELKTADHTRQQ